ncbi:CIC11C00000002381 [Sungouiella intermedia]|uniref:CIC11C00000002381 n=1 Tax=Sungouiella intermedia TaxID=45354 RepID=A0A1L0BVH9_9ASCO|nr:CIC11C00000002381 [[Candida] intermedia]
MPGMFPLSNSITKVEFMTTIDKPGFFSLIRRKQAVFYFGVDDTIEQAAEHAASNYPDTHSPPIFKEICVFFKNPDLFMDEIAVTDVQKKVHSIFSGNDTMIISNDPKIFEVQLKQLTRLLCSSLLLMLLTAWVLYSLLFR